MSDKYQWQGFDKPDKLSESKFFLSDPDEDKKEENKEIDVESELNLEDEIEKDES